MACAYYGRFCAAFACGKATIAHLALPTPKPSPNRIKIALFFQTFCQLYVFFYILQRNLPRQKEKV